MTAALTEELGAHRLLIAVLYRGPWERAVDWLWKLDRLDDSDDIGPENEEVSEKSLRGRLAVWAERRDFAWREKYVQTDTRPKDRWKR